MTMLLTLNHTDQDRVNVVRWLAALATAALIAVAMPVVACDKGPNAQVASMAAGAAVFTGEFVNGAPVYRLPAINVVAHRPAEVAKTQRVEVSAPSVGSRASSAAVAPPAPKRSAMTASRDTKDVRPCIG